MSQDRKEIEQEINNKAKSVSIPVIQEYASILTGDSSLFENETIREGIDRNIVLADAKKIILIKAEVVNMKEYKFPDYGDNKTIKQSIEFIYSAINKLWQPVLSECKQRSIQDLLRHKLILNPETSTFYVESNNSPMHIGITLVQKEHHSANPQ